MYDSKDDDACLKVIDFGTSIAFDPSKAQNSKLGTVNLYNNFNLNNRFLLCVLYLVL
jgi:hypothetical protein